MDSLSSYLTAFFATLSLQARDEKTSLWILLAAALGVATVSKYVVSLGKVIFDLARPGISLNKFGAKTGSWALVTGCTAGIGREFALQLSKAGFKILLVARNEKELEKLQSELATTSRIHLLDLATADSSSYASLSETIASLDGPVGVLVNNVGLSHAMPVPFQDTEESEMKGIIDLNVNAAMRVTKVVLPGMIKTRKGLILNIGSFASLTPSAYLSTYSGSKAFLYTWSQSLGSELSSYPGITVSLINTYFVVSALSKIRKPSLLIPLPKPYVKSVLSHIGRQCGAVGHPFVSTPYWSHALVQWLVDNVGTRGLWMEYTRRMQVDIRRRALKKREREANKVTEGRKDL